MTALAVGAVQARTAIADITVTDWTLVTRARDDFRPFVETIHETVQLPFHQTQATVDGGTFARSTYDFEVASGSAMFDFDFEFSRSPSLSRGEALGGVVLTLAEPLEYDLAGSLTLSGTGILVLHVLLVDFSTSEGELVYSGYHDSRATVNESFTLGASGGDTSSREEGSLSGMLAADTPYGLLYDYWTENYPVVNDSATASGSLGFVLTPEPCSVLLVVTGALILTKRRR